eukprot:363783-Chlamydomonas_euryale.AAC.7
MLTGMAVQFCMQNHCQLVAQVGRHAKRSAFSCKCDPPNCAPLGCNLRANPIGLARYALKAAGLGAGATMDHHRWSALLELLMIGESMERPNAGISTLVTRDHPQAYVHQCQGWPSEA